MKRTRRKPKRTKLVGKRLGQSSGYTFCTSYTKSEIAELKKCKSNPIYCMTKYFNILDPSVGYISFKDMYKHQKKIICDWILRHFLVTLKSRQTGISTITGALALWCCLMLPNFRVGVLSIRSQEATYYLDVIKNIFEHLPPFLRRRVTIDNRQYFAFSNGSSIRTSTTTEKAFRSFAFNLLVIDEAAHIDKLDITYGAMWPTLSRAFKSTASRPYGVIMVSTPKGVGNLYHKTWQLAEQGRNIYTPCKIYWRDVPGYDQAWYEEQCKALNYDERQIAQELELQFLGTGDEYFATEVLENLKEMEPMEALDLPEAEARARLEVWKWPRRNRMYLLGCDVATKVGYDYTCIDVVDYLTGEQCAQIAGKFDSIQGAALIKRIGTYYNNALAIVENNGPGMGVIDPLMRAGYNNLYYYEPEKPGIRVSVTNRQIILNTLYQLSLDYHPEKKPLIKSGRTMEEMKTFVWGKSKPEAMSGYHDDTIFSLAHCIYVRTMLTGRAMGTITEEDLDALTNTMLESLRERTGERMRDEDPHEGQILTPEQEVEIIKSPAPDEIGDDYSDQDVILDAIS